MPGTWHRRGTAGHADAGLQPERTTLAWNRTTLAMVVLAAVFLRWMPHHGLFTGVLVLLTLCVALALNLTQRLRYRRAVRGIAAESTDADVLAALLTSLTIVVLALMGIFIVLFLPVNS